MNSSSLEFIPAHPVSGEEIAELSRRNPALRFERTPQGALIVSPTGSSGSLRNTDLTRQLFAWNDRSKLGRVFDSSGGFALANNAIYAPDGAWLSEPRWKALNNEQREGFAPLCPDVVFEIRSKSDSSIKLLRKLHDYIEAGATLAVLIDPYQQTITHIFNGEEPRTFTNPSSLRFISTEGLEPLLGFVFDFQSLLQSTE